MSQSVRILSVASAGGMACVRRLLIPGLVSLVGCSQPCMPTVERPAASATTEGAGRDAAGGITTERVGMATVHPTISRVGWYEPPAAATTVVRAPATGFVAARDDGPWPAIGDRAEAGRSSLQLSVFLAPQELAQLVHLKEDTDTQLQQSLVTMQLTEEQLRQASTARDAISGVRLDQIRQAFEHARAAYHDAQEKLRYQLLENADHGVTLRPVPIDTPRTGVVTEVAASPGQFVATGDPLYTVADWSTLWVRVPVFEGDLGTIDDARVVRVTDRVTRRPVEARPLRLPATAKAGGRAFDLWYAVDNAAGTLQPGRTALVALPVRGCVAEAMVVVPRSAVLYDGFGRASCFVKGDGDGQPYARRQLELGDPHGAGVVVRHGLDAGEEVVVAGAEQLAGAAAILIPSAEDDE